MSLQSKLTEAEIESTNLKKIVTTLQKENRKFKEHIAELRLEINMLNANFQEIKTITCTASVQTESNYDSDMDSDIVDVLLKEMRVPRLHTPFSEISEDVLEGKCLIKPFPYSSTMLHIALCLLPKILLCI